MNRLQKKCVIATAGFHLLLLVILFVGPAFFNSKPKMDDSQVLDVIPANLIDAAFNSGVKDATPPAPQPIVQPQPQQMQPTPPAPAPKPVEPTPTLVHRIENLFTPEPKPEPEKQTPETRENQSHKIQPNLTPVVRGSAPKNSKPDNSRQKTKAIDSALTNLRHNLSSATEITMPGNSSAAYANYASVVKNVYDAAWTLPDTIAKDENITVSVTIANDGTVISAHIVTPSGDASADDSVQRALDRVKFVAAFPEGTTDKERTYTIVFNPQIKNSE
ncbi:MAG TPA: TonB family protein [Verrucomicrobiae bacterium]|jgi:TonB family protein